MQKGMSKRAQVTVFVVIAVVIVALAGVSYLVVKNKGSDVPKTPEEVAFKTYMDGCSNACLRASLVDLGYNGGYYDLNGISNSDFLMINFPFLSNLMISSSVLVSFLTSAIFKILTSPSIFAWAIEAKQSNLTNFRSKR